MKGKTKLRSVVALLLAFVLVFVGIDPMGWISGTIDEVQAEDLTSITWTDFGFTLGTTYTGATDESSAASNAGSYASATNLNNTEFVGDVVFGDNSEIRYGGSAYNYGLKLKVEDGAFKVGGSNLYLYSTTDGSQISEIMIPKTDAGNYGLTSFADEQFTLKIQITGWNGNSGWSTMYAGIWINDVAVIESVKLGSGAFGNMFCTCVYGSVTPSVKLTEITWTDFGFTLGTTYTGATDESSAPSNAGSYESATNLNNTEFVGDVVFGDNSEIRYGGSAYNYGLKIKVEDGAFKVSGSNLYLYSTTDGSQISEIVIPKTDAGNYGLTSFADEQFTLKIKITGWNGNSGWSTMYAGIWINDVAVVESVKLGSSNFGNMFCTCVYGSVTPSAKLTKITWEDFGFTLGTTYTGATDESSAASNAGSYESATNLNNTEFVGDVVFGDNSEIRYGGSAYNYGLKIKVEDGAFKVSGSNLYLYSTTDGSQISEIVIPKTDAGNYGLTSFADEQFTLKIKITGWNGNSGWSTMYAGIWINDVAVVESVKLGSSNFGNMFCTCVYGSVTPSVKLTPITWTDFTFGGVALTDGQSISSAGKAVYSKGDTLNNTAFEGDISLPSGSGFFYASNNGYFGLSIKESSGDLLIGGTTGVLLDGSNQNNKYTCTAAEYNDGTPFTDDRFTIRIELYNLVKDGNASSANVKVYINGKQVADEMTIETNAGNIAYSLDKGIGFGNNGMNTGATIYDVMPTLTPITWTNFNGTYGTTYTSLGTLTYEEDSLNNTSFEGDIVFSSGAMMRYAGVNGYFGLRMGVNASGNFFIGGHPSAYIDGSADAIECTPGNLGLTKLADTRITLKIEMWDVTDTQATVSVYVNGNPVKEEFTLTGNTGHVLYKFGNKVGFCAEEDNTSITILNNKPVPTGLTELSWEEFGYTGGQIYTAGTSKEVSYLENLNNTLFNGNVELIAGSNFYYGGNGWQGVQFTVNTDGTLTLQTAGSSTAYSVTLNPAHYGLTSFAGENFNLKIAMTDRTLVDETNGKYSQVVRVFANDQILGDAFTYTEWQANVLGNDLVMNVSVAEGASSSITPYSNRTTTPTDLTSVQLKDWKEDVAVDFELIDQEIAAAHPSVDTLIGTTFYETVKFVGDETTADTHNFCYGGIIDGNAWYGTKFYLSGKNMIILCTVDGVNALARFTLDPVVAGVGDSFVNTEFSWRIDTVKLNDESDNVLMYVSFNGKLYNNAPFVICDFADVMSNTIRYNSYTSGTTEQLQAYYVELGTSEKPLPVLYHDLTKGVYTIPEYQTVTFYEKNADGEWVEATKPTTLTKTGDYKIEFNDGVSDYTQEIACYYYETDVDAASLVRSVKMRNGKEETDWKHYETRLCDTDYDGKVDADDVNDIKSMLLGTYLADTDVMKISGFFSPTASLIKDETYAAIKETGVNHIIESDIYYTDEPIDRYRIYQELSYAQKYGLTVTVNDKRLTDIGESGGKATVETVQNKVVNYKDYQSFAGLFIVDEPKAKDYPNVGTWKGYTQVEDHSSVAKAIAAAGYEGWSNAFGGDSGTLDNGYNWTAGCRMRYGYYQYLGNLVDSFDLQFMSVTDYPFIVDGSSTKDSDIQYYFMNLAMAKDVATKKGVDLRTFVQGAAAMETTLNNSFNEAQLKWHANIDLTFGSSALEFFPLVQPATLMTYADGSCASGLLDSDGNLTKFGEWATSVNKQVAAIDDILLNATHEGFMAVGGSSYATTIARNSIESIAMKTGGWLSSASTTLTNKFYDNTYEGASVTSSNTEYGAFAGCFEITAGEHSGKHAMYIVNFSDVSDNTVTVNLGDAVTSTTIYQGKPAEHTGTFDMKLAAGEAVLVVY